jgi:hypothetical protein
MISRLRVVPDAFASSTSRTIISIPASAEIIGERCFADRKSLRRITFEGGSELPGLDAEALFKCGSWSDEMQPQVGTILQYPLTLRADLEPPLAPAK